VQSLLNEVEPGSDEVSCPLHSRLHWQYGAMISGRARIEGEAMMDTINFDSFATLHGYKMPHVPGDRGMKIAEGKLSDMIKRALALSDLEYHGLTISHDGPMLKKKDMKEISQRPDFPK
jgi:hypothetical protein